jgi:hypothetical protein
MAAEWLGPESSHEFRDRLRSATSTVSKSGGRATALQSGFATLCGVGYRRWMHVIVWRFTTDQPAEFEHHYGPRGTWAAFFGRSADYVRTDLLRGDDAYLTLDWWTSREAYDAFREEHSAEYAEIDDRCEEVTRSEENLGSYLRLE